MNQKKQKLEKAKLIDQAKIMLEASKAIEKDSEKIAFVIKAALILTHHHCPERTESFRKAIALLEKLEQWDMMLNLAVVGLKKTKNYKEDIDFYQDTIKKCQDKAHEINSNKDEKT